MKLTKTKKRILSVFLTLAMIITGMSVSAFASDNMTIVAESDKATVYKDDTFTITVKVGATTQAIGAMQIQLVYDETKLEYQSSALGELGNKFTSQKSVTDEHTSTEDYVDGMFVVNDAAIPNSAESVLFNVTFKALKDADESVAPLLRVVDDVIYDGDYNEIPFSLTQATVATAKKPVAVTGITIDETLAVYVGDSATPSWTVTPDDATNKAVSFSSSDETVATVDSATGEVTGVAEGTATITVTTQDGSNLSDTCTVTVTIKPCTHEYENKVDAKYLVSGADCDSAAVYKKSCKHCGEAHATETFEDGTALGHDYSEKIADDAHLKTASTDCQTAAVYWYDCIRCDANAKDDANAADKYYNSNVYADHNFSGEWEKDAEGHWYVCQTTGCNAADTKVGHNPSDWCLYKTLERTDSTEKLCKDTVRIWTEANQGKISHKKPNFLAL